MSTYGAYLFANSRNSAARQRLVCIRREETKWRARCVTLSPLRRAGRHGLPSPNRLFQGTGLLCVPRRFFVSFVIAVPRSPERRVLRPRRDDVENVHVYSYGSMCGFNKKWRSNRKRIAMEQSSINLALKTECYYSRAINSSTQGLS